MPIKAIAGLMIRIRLASRPGKAANTALDRTNSINADIRNSGARYRTPAATPGRATQKGTLRVIEESRNAIAPSTTASAGQITNQNNARWPTRERSLTISVVVGLTLIEV